MSSPVAVLLSGLFPVVCMDISWVDAYNHELYAASTRRLCIMDSEVAERDVFLEEGAGRDYLTYVMTTPWFTE